MNLGSCYADLKQYEAARVWYDRALALEPENEKCVTQRKDLGETMNRDTGAGLQENVV